MAEALFPMRKGGGAAIEAAAGRGEHVRDFRRGVEQPCLGGDCEVVWRCDLE